MLDIQKISKKFGDFTAVNNVEFKAIPGEVLGFLGPNGAGKSTALKILSGYITPTSGCVELNNIDISKTIKVTDAQNLKLTINGETEKNFDWIYIYDENDNEIYVGSGTFNNKSIDISGSEVTIRLTTDGSITKSGLTINLEGLGCQEEPTISLGNPIEITEGDSGDKELICLF